MPLKITILLFDNYTALDVIGPYEVLAKLPDSKIYMVGCEKGEYKDQYGLRMIADYSLDEISHTDVLLIPGGFGIDNLLKNNDVILWVQRMHEQTLWTTSVCSGALLLAEAGILDAKNCTTHWRRKEQLKHYNVSIKNERYVEDGKIITSAGVSAGIDMALFLVSKISGEQIARSIQLALEYDPSPPFDYGSPDKAFNEIVSKLRK